MRPVQHGGEESIRLVWRFTSDERTVEVRYHTLELGE